jgi:EAL domain-containing protein (putative c-di-GMP-specific phosphodiesterase class I)
VTVESLPITRVMTASAPETADTTALIHEALSGDCLSVVVQPIVELGDRLVIGFEALARFATLPQRSPDWWFAQAAAVGLGDELELAALDRALGLLPELPRGTHLSVNASPATVLSDGFAERLDALPQLDRLVLEVTEHAPIYERFGAALDRHRGRGLELAIDDTGAGFASLRHILRLRPDTIKLDRTITDRIDCDRNTRALAAALTSFALETQTRVNAEGIETASQLGMAQALGVTLGQGYLLGRPAPPSQTWGR